MEGASRAREIAVRGQRKGSGTPPYARRPGKSFWCVVRRHLFNDIFLDVKVQEACRGIFIAQTCLLFCVETLTPDELLWHLERATLAPSPAVEGVANDSAVGADCDIVDAVGLAGADLTTPRRATSIAMQAGLLQPPERDRGSLLSRSPCVNSSSKPSLHTLSFTSEVGTRPYRAT